MIADPSYRLVLLDELNIVLRYDYLPLDEVVAVLKAQAARPARRRHRPQRPARADRGRRPRHRDDAGQASVPRRRQGAAGDRVLMSRARLMLQGTGSDVGKSLLLAGLARAFTRRGLRVRPFKPQNMSNNAAVTADGGEIGRAQALQARACGVAPGHRHEPGAAEAAIGERRADRAARPGLGQRRGAREYRRWRRACCRRSSPPSTGSPRAPISCSSKAPAARPKSICAPATSPIWALPRRPMCRSCWSAISSAAASSPSWSARTRCCRRPSGRARRLYRQQVPRRCRACSTAASPRSANAPGCAALASCRFSPRRSYAGGRLAGAATPHPRCAGSPSPHAGEASRGG